MLRSLKNLQDFALVATDGHVGHLDKCYFDDATWVTRYLVIAIDETWFNRQRVLISPISVQGVNEKDKTIYLTVTREQLKLSPDIDTERPVSRQREIEYHQYYGYPTYWQGQGIWGYGGYPNELNSEHALYDPIWADAALSPVYNKRVANGTQAHPNDPHLRSSDEVTSYHIEATDGEVGHCDDLLIDDESWSIRYLVVKTGHWWKGARVLIVPRAITEVSWSKSLISVVLSREGVKHSPHFSSIASLNLSTLLV